MVRPRKMRRRDRSLTLYAANREIGPFFIGPFSVLVDELQITGQPNHTGRRQPILFGGSVSISKYAAFQIVSHLPCCGRLDYTNTSASFTKRKSSSFLLLFLSRRRAWNASRAYRSLKSITIVRPIAGEHTVEKRGTVSSQGAGTVFSKRGR